MAAAVLRHVPPRGRRRRRRRAGGGARAVRRVLARHRAGLPRLLRGGHGRAAVSAHESESRPLRGEPARARGALRRARPVQRRRRQLAPLDRDDGLRRRRRPPRRRRARRRRRRRPRRRRRRRDARAGRGRRCDGGATGHRGRGGRRGGARVVQAVELRLRRPRRDLREGGAPLPRRHLDVERPQVLPRLRRARAHGPGVALRGSDHGGLAHGRRREPDGGRRLRRRRRRGRRRPRGRANPRRRGEALLRRRRGGRRRPPAKPGGRRGHGRARAPRRARRRHRGQGPRVPRGVEIKQRAGLSRPNFGTLSLGQIEVDSADFWTNRWLSSSARSTAEILASSRSITRT